MRWSLGRSVLLLQPDHEPASLETQSVGVPARRKVRLGVALVGQVHQVDAGPGRLDRRVALNGVHRAPGRHRARQEGSQRLGSLRPTDANLVERRIDIISGGIDFLA